MSEHSVHIQVDPKLLEAFDLMWGSYPGPASLVHRSKTIMAVNEACRAGGRAVGMKCVKWDSPERHKGCLAHQALQEQKPLYKEGSSAQGIFRVYWLPVAGYPDFYVHFTTETLSLNSSEV